MPSATFVADFSQFQAAVNAASVTLKGFEGDANKVEKALNKIGESFSGNAIRQQAALVQKAIEDIGGVTKLTAAEQAKANDILEEALEKYSALGTQAPPGMRELAAATKQASDDTTLMSTAMSHLVSIASVSLLAKWALDAFEFAGQLADLSARTNVSAEALQRWDVIAQANGTTVDALAAAAFQLSRRLAEGKDSTVGALTELGIRLEDVKAMDAATRMETLGTAVASIEDPMRRAAVGTALFGKAVDDLTPALKELQDGAGPLVTITTEQAVAFDKAGDAAGRLLSSWKPLLVQWIDSKINLSGVVRAMEEWNAQVDVSKQVQDQAAAAGKSWTASMNDRAAHPITITVSEENAIIADLNTQMKAAAVDATAWAAAQAKAAEAAERAAAAQQRMLDVIERSDRSAQGFTARAVALGDALRTVGTHTEVSMHDLDDFIAAQQRAAAVAQNQVMPAWTEANVTLIGTGPPLDALVTKTDAGSEAMLRMTQVATGLHEQLDGVSEAAQRAFDHAVAVNTALGVLGGVIQGAAGLGLPVPGISQFTARASGIPTYQSGGPVAQTGLAFLHAGETVVPAGAPGIGGSPTINVYVTQPLGTPTEIGRVVGEALTVQLKTLGIRQPWTG